MQPETFCKNQSKYFIYFIYQLAIIVLLDNYFFIELRRSCKKNYLVGDLNSELNSLFKPSVTQAISQTTYDLNVELLIRYLSHDLNK